MTPPPNADPPHLVTVARAPPGSGWVDEWTGGERERRHDKVTKYTASRTGPRGASYPGIAYAVGSSSLL